MKFIDKFSEYASNELNLSQDDTAKVNYAATLIFGDISKLVILFIAFTVLGVSQEYIYALFPLLVLRTLMGGLHFKTYKGCLIFTTFYFTVTILSSLYVDLTQFSAIAISILLIFIMFICGPIQSKSRPKLSSQRKTLYTTVSSVFILIHTLNYFSNANNPYYNIAIWAIIYQIIQLLFAKGGLYYEKFKIQQTT